MKKPGSGPGFSTARFGVADGARTHDNRNHNPGLYQLSYSHRRALNYSGSLAVISEASIIGLARWPCRLPEVRPV